MTKERCFQTLLSQIVRAVVDGNLPPMTEVVKLHTFLNQLDVLEIHHPVHALEALGDWVPRLLDGIATSSLITIKHPPLMLQASTQQSTIYMDLVVDAMATIPHPSVNPRCLSALIPEPRFTVCEVFSHKIEGGKLSYWVRWEGNDFYEMEVYKNLHHLTIFKEYEDNIVPVVPTGTRVRSAKQKATLDNYEYYLRLRDEAISQLTEEFDTDDEDDQVAVMQQDRHSFSPMEHIASDDSMSWGDLLVADDDGPFLPSNLDLGGSFGAAGPSYQGELFSWRE
jgi:hypothetical protein